jgi:hypothetical protein
MHNLPPEAIIGRQKTDWLMVFPALLSSQGRRPALLCSQQPEEEFHA